MARTKGNLSNSEPKNQIIKFILKNNGPVEESKIRAELKKKNKKTDQGNVNRYSHELQKESDCIELETIKKGQRKYNLWNVTKIEQLKNILRNFPEIQLNEYEKSVNIVLKKFDFIAFPMLEKKAFVQLSLSVSFFNKCLDTDIETLCIRASKIPQPDEYFSPERQIEGNIERLSREVYSECMRRIQKVPSFRPIADEYIENSVNFDVYQNNPQRFQSNAISEEKFKRMLGGMKFSWKETDYHGEIQRIIKELSIKISQEIISKRLKELSEASLQNQEVTNKMSDEIFEKLMEELPIDLPDKILEIIINRIQKTSIIFENIFDHFYQRDIIDGNDNPEEQKLMSAINEITSYNCLEIKKMSVTVNNLNHLYDDYYEKCRKKMGIV